MNIQQLKDVAQAMKEKGFMTADEKDIWSKFLSPEEVLKLVDHIESLEQQIQQQEAA